MPATAAPAAVKRDRRTCVSTLDRRSRRVTRLEKDEKRLVELARSGNVDAFGEIYECHSPGVYNLVYRMLGNREDAEDVKQEVFIRVHRALGSFKGDARFSTWLYRIAANVCLDHIRRRKPTVSSEGLKEESQWEAPDGGASGDPQRQLDSKLTQEAVQAALQIMPPHYRILMVLRHIEGLSYEEISQVLGCPVTSLNVRLHRAREAFRKAVEPLLPTDEESDSGLQKGPETHLAVY